VLGISDRRSDLEAWARESHRLPFKIFTLVILLITCVIIMMAYLDKQDCCAPESRGAKSLRCSCVTLNHYKDHAVHSFQQQCSPIYGCQFWYSFNCIHNAVYLGVVQAELSPATVLLHRDHRRTVRARGRGGCTAAAPQTRARPLFFGQKLNFSGRSQQPKMKKVLFCI